MRIHPIWNQYPYMQRDLQDVLRVMEKNIKIRDKQVEKNIKELIHAGGKMLRPAYTLLCAHIGPHYECEEATAVAAALEVLHMATLIHDDIIDDAETRRNQPTIQSKYGKKYAVYTGDYLFCVCFKILAKHSKSLTSIEFDTKHMEKILVGELDQMNMRYNIDISIRQYLKQISGKTAQLFALSCYSGASISEASPSLIRTAWNIGHNMGMAFQIIDDILDYTRNAEQIGKPVLNDIKQGVYSLPLIYAIRENKKAFQPILEKREHMTDADLEMILTLIHQYRGVEKAQALAEKYTNKAMKLIKTLPDGQYKHDMLEITSTILNREL